MIRTTATFRFEDHAIMVADRLRDAVPACATVRNGREVWTECDTSQVVDAALAYDVDTALVDVQAVPS